MKTLSGLGLPAAVVAAVLVALPSARAPITAAQAAAPPSACTFPTAQSATPAETAWRIFIAANCPGRNGKLVWENWIEQAQLYPAGGTGLLAASTGNRLHGSPLAIAERIRKAGGRVNALSLVASTEVCSPIQQNAQGLPNNVVSGAQVCEEAHLNPAAQAFVTGASYRARPGQTAAAQKGTDIEFTTPSIEVKVDWIPAKDFAKPFSCATPPAGLFVEVINGQCYGLAGMHIASKLASDWVWATFEPQSMVTNTLRCISFGPCNDPYGSTPAVSNGGAAGFTKLTPQVAALMRSAHLAAPFANYRMDGVQVDFTDAAGAPTYLGNSIIEGENVGMTYNTASCITCHSVSSIKTDGTDGITVLAALPNPPVGPKYVIPAGWIARDFVWSMGLACPVPAGTFGLQTCTTSKKK